MTESDQRAMGEIMGLLGQTWKGLLVNAGVGTGLFEELNTDTPVSLEDLARKIKFDEQKLESWLYYVGNEGYVLHNDCGYMLSDKGKVLTRSFPSKDLIGLLGLTDYYMNAALNAKDTFLKDHSMEKLSAGKITRNYQPRVTDKFSEALISVLRDYGISNGDSLLDVGCGKGSFIRNVSIALPDIQLTGVDSNLFAIERGKKENADLGLSDRVKLVVGDVTEDLGDFDDLSCDWSTAINLFHFIPVDKRYGVIQNMLRIARKGIFVTEVAVEATPLSRAANPLMFLLWDDFSGFFKQDEIDVLNDRLKQEYGNYKFQVHEIMHGNSSLLVIRK